MFQREAKMVRVEGGRPGDILSPDSARRAR